ncbi:MAG: hypothetical protein ACI358_00425 [Candidatus Limimorpha sp.]
MNRIFKDIITIILILTALSFYACKSTSSRSELYDFNFSYNNKQEYIEKYVSMAEEIDQNNAKDPVLLEKISQIYYLYGRNLYNKKEYIAATEALIKSYLAKTYSVSYNKYTSDDDFHFLGQIADALGDIYNDVNSLKAASFFYNDALEQFTKAHRQHEVIDMLLKIGDLYEYNHIPNIALLNYETAEEKKNLTEEQLNTIMIKKGISLYHIQDNGTADSIFNSLSSLSLHSIDFHYFASYYFYNQNNFPKAVEHLIPCFNYGSPNIKLKAAEKLAEIYFLLGDRGKEFEFAQYQAKVQSSEARLTPTRLQLEAFFDSFINNNENISNKSHSPIFLISSVTTALLLFSALLVLFFKKKKKGLDTQPDTSAQTDVHAQCEETVSETADNAKEPMTTASYEGSMTETPTITEEPTQELTVPRSFDDDYATFVNSTIYKEIKNSFEGKEFFIKTVGDYPKLALTKNKMFLLNSTFNNSFPNLTHTLISKYPELTMSDIRFIIFSLMGFNDIEIAVLLKQTYSSANKRANKLKAILQTDEPLFTYIPTLLRSIKY